MKNKALALSLALLLFLVTLTSCQPSTISTQQAETTVPTTQEQIITIGVVSSDPAASIGRFQPIADYLATKLEAEGFLKGKVLVLPDFAAMEQKLQSGEVDLFFESPYGAWEAYTKVGAVPLLRRWKSGVSEYNTLIVVKKDSGIQSLDNLRGKMIAFEDSGSTSGYYLPKAYFNGLGYVLVEKQEATSSIEENQIGYFFTGDVENSFTLLLRGKVAAAAIQSDDLKDFPQTDLDQTTVLAETSFVPRHIALASPALAENLRMKIIEILLGMDETEEGRSILQATEETAKFDELPLGPKGTMDALGELFAPSH